MQQAFGNGFSALVGLFFVDSLVLHVHFPACATSALAVRQVAMKRIPGSIWSMTSQSLPPLPDRHSSGLVQTANPYFSSWIPETPDIPPDLSLNTPNSPIISFS
ncbi:hypothetical protein TNCT_177941 [Trichonephila clavata]|uniref:Uncharacterized protein n=1 Tax=Trichonephila clavata TaxID=2740835 RepID=A0A8X6GNF5_TRICU|nr:hypothetical protein TNCT_177941 [Trichonephila clavata]